jgi:uncharacterized protein (DUF1330 family)
MSAYILADVTVTDPDKMAEYRQWSTRATQEHGGEFLVRGGAFEVLEGPWTPSRLVLVRFADRATAKAFYDSETYRQARAIRKDAGVMRMVLVDGVDA